MFTLFLAEILFLADEMEFSYAIDWVCLYRAWLYYSDGVNTLKVNKKSLKASSFNRDRLVSTNHTKTAATENVIIDKSVGYYRSRGRKLFAC